MNGEAIEIGVGTISELTRLLAVYGVYMLFVFFSIYMFYRARKNLQEACEEEDKKLYRKQCSIVLYTILVLAALVSTVWIYATFVYSPRVVIEGTFKNLAEQTATPVDPTTLIHRIVPFRSDVAFYTSKESKIGESRYDLDWVMVSRSGFEILIFEFQQRYRNLRTANALAIEDAARQRSATVIRKVKIKLATLEGLSNRKLHIEYRDHPEDDDGSSLGNLFLLDTQGELVRLPWMDEQAALHDASSTDPPVVSSFFAAGVAWAQSLDLQESLFVEGRADLEVEQQIVRFLGSDNLKEQILAREALVREEELALAFIRRVVEEGDEGRLDQDLVVHNLAVVVEETQRSGTPVPADLNLLLADTLFRIGSFERAAQFYERVADLAVGTPSRFLRLGAAYFELGSLPEALGAFQRYLKEMGDPRSRSTVLSHMGFTYLRLEQLDDAIKSFQQALELDPTNHRARRVLAAAYRQEDKGWLDGANLLKEMISGPAPSESDDGYTGVARSGFTRGIMSREPVDHVETLAAAEGVVFYFTEMINLEGRNITHRWIFDGKTRAEIPIPVGGPRWRVYSSKRLLPEWTGEWQVHVLDDQGNKLWEESLLVTKGVS